jgi:hypothetical protein
VGFLWPLLSPWCPNWLSTCLFCLRVNPALDKMVAFLLYHSGIESQSTSMQKIFSIQYWHQGVVGVFTLCQWKVRGTKVGFNPVLILSINRQIYITWFNNVPKQLFVFAFSIVFYLQIFNSGNNMHLIHSLALLGSPLTRRPVLVSYTGSRSFVIK